MSPKKWFWIRWNAEGDVEICSIMFEDYDEALANQKTFKGMTLCETVWG